MRFRSTLLLLGFSLLISVTGCSSSPYVPASGKVVTGDGHAVQTGKIEFRHREERTQFAGHIDKIGKFTLADLDGMPGVLPGLYDVVIVQVVLTEDLVLEKHTHGVTLSRHYADYYTSGLTYTIGEDGDEDIKIVVEAD